MGCDTAGWRFRRSRCCDASCSIDFAAQESLDEDVTRSQAVVHAWPEEREERVPGTVGMCCDTWQVPRQQRRKLHIASPSSRHVHSTSSSPSPHRTCERAPHTSSIPCLIPRVRLFQAIWLRQLRQRFSRLLTPPPFSARSSSYLMSSNIVSPFHFIFLLIISPLFCLIRYCTK